MGFHNNLDILFEKIDGVKEYDVNILKNTIHDLYDLSWNKKGIKLRHKICDNIELIIEDDEIKY